MVNESNVWIFWAVHPISCYSLCKLLTVHLAGLPLQREEHIWQRIIGGTKNHNRNKSSTLPFVFQNMGLLCSRNRNEADTEENSQVIYTLEVDTLGIFPGLYMVMRYWLVILKYPSCGWSLHQISHRLQKLKGGLSKKQRLKSIYKDFFFLVQ